MKEERKKERKKSDASSCTMCCVGYATVFYYVR